MLSVYETSVFFGIFWVRKREWKKIWPHLTSGSEVSSHVRKKNTEEHDQGPPFSPYDCVSSKSSVLFLSLQEGKDHVIHYIFESLLPSMVPGHRINAQ